MENFGIFYSLRAKEKRISYGCEISPDVPNHLRGDVGRLRQILSNLVGNAFKFTQKGGIRVSASLESSSDSDIRLRASVRDSGIGISKEKHGTLFDKFGFWTLVGEHRDKD